jgi:5-keto 4-deoxyuronate isomerase
MFPSSVHGGTVEVRYRVVFGGAMPGAEPLRLEPDDALCTDHFCERRELAAFCVGGRAVNVDGIVYRLERGDLVYEDVRLVHILGEPDETRHLIVRNEQAVISPAWSVHSGAATGSYSLIWFMAGENYRFDDMDHIAMADLR